MDTLRNYKKISLLAVAILFLFTLFNLILDAPRILKIYFELAQEIRVTAVFFLLQNSHVKNSTRI